jgi:hypothetical protein
MMDTLAFHTRIGSLLLKGVQALRSAGRSPGGLDYSEALTADFRKALEEVDRFFGLDTCILLMRDRQSAERISVVTGTSAKNSLFRHERFAPGSEFLKALVSRQVIQPIPLERERFPGDRLWELLWQTMHFGPYAAPWSLVGLALYPEGANVPVSELDIVGGLILIGPQGWYPPNMKGTVECLEFLACQFQGAVEFIQLMRLLEISSFEYVDKLASIGQPIILHGVLVPLQRLEFSIFRSERDFEKGETKQPRERLTAMRTEIFEIKRHAKTYMDICVAGPTDHATVPPALREEDWVDLGQTTLEVTRDLEALGRRKNLTFVTRIVPGTKIPVRKDHFEIIVGNVLHNAIKYGYTGTKIKIEQTQKPPDVILDFTSYGIPISEEEREKIFRLGFRTAAASKMEYAAAGIGLYAARQAAERWGGRLFVHASEFETSVSEVDRYRNTFRFTIKAKR